LSFKNLFSRSLNANPERLHFASHSHHLWPDASFEGQVEAWNDAARLADEKWDRVMDEVWPEAQANVAAELGTDNADSIVFSSNTHDLLIRLAAACPRHEPRQLRVLTTDGEFHSARRQFARWAEEGWVTIDQVSAEPFDSFSDRFVERAYRGEHDFIFVSQVLFGSGRLFDHVEELAAMSQPNGPWVVIDGYHAFMAIHDPFGPAEASAAFYLGGGYKYAMSGEGCAFLHAPPGYGERPPVTGWFAEFEDLTLRPGSVGYASDARRFMGATFDPSAIYRFIAVRRMLVENGLTTVRISRHVETLQNQLLDSVYRTPLAAAELLNPLDRDKGTHARFLAFRSPDAQAWHSALKAKNCITDVRGDVLRVGFGLYQDESDVERLLGLLQTL
jgi:selenocysteine lyase/cysteine desulfurase